MTFSKERMIKQSTSLMIAKNRKVTILWMWRIIWIEGSFVDKK